MYLKKIEMRGFKTFADRSELDFGPGITAIVGPNGTGKSNIADAILWALGEQSNRALRTETSQDVVFAGSQARRPLGMSEVNLTLDNSDHGLATDYSEVVVSRRLFRTGESEYLINRGSARLRDIRDLFLDTGVGPQAYSVIGQGEIDAILSIRSEDRRELLEEVAGIHRYRVRRDEATRKLEATQANMTRVADIVAELKGQREPLEREAERAREYNTVAERLRELELALLADDYRKRYERIGRLAHEVEIAKADLQATRNRTSQVDAEYEKVQFEVARLANEVDRLRDEATRAERELDHARQAQALADERIRAAVERQKDLSVVLEGQQRRAGDLRGQLETVAGELEGVTAAHREIDQERQGLAAELEQKAAQYGEKMAGLQELGRAQGEALDRAAALENEALALQSLEADLGERAERLATQSQALAEREAKSQADLRATQERRQSLSEALETRRGELAALRADLALATETLREHRHKCGIFSGAVTAREAEQKLLAELERSREGLRDGPKLAVQAGAEGRLPGVIGVVADLIEVPARLERALEAALGETLSWVVTETEEQAVGGARFVQETGAGRATFVALTSFATTPLPTPPLTTPMVGSVGAAFKVVRYKREYEKIFARLLGDTMVVKDLDAALALRRQLRSRIKLVTLAGECVGAEGEITAGGAQGPGARSFLRRRELEALSAELDLLRHHLAEAFRREEGLDQWCQRLTQQIHEGEREAAELQSQAATAETEITHLADQGRAARESSRELAEEATALGERLAQAREQRAAGEAESATLRARGEELGAQMEAARRTGVAQAEVDALRAREVNSRVRAAELAEKERALQQLVERYQAELERAEEESSQARHGLEAAGQTEAELRAQAVMPGDDLPALERRAGAAREKVTAGFGRLSELRERSAELDNARIRLAQTAQEQSDRIHRSELGCAREEAQLDGIAERLQEIYSVTPEEAVTALGGQTPEREVRQEANDLRERIRRLGPVSLSAIDECDRLRAREDYLAGQLGDLEAARADLLSVIQQIDEAATSEFVRAFEQVQVQFQVMFDRLFGGGTTELRLSDPERPLESGVDVMVQVPGKRQQNLLLLSGGERALTASALLFAMLKVKPTPFCVMDEIDAALDEANVGRFADLLRDFATESQFIIVTHNPHTIKCADVLFGVTMEEAGVSKLIRLELREWGEFMAEAERQTGGHRPARAGSRVLPTAI